MFGSRGVGGLKVGEVYAAAGVRVDESGFHEWDRRYDKVQRDARSPVEGHGRFRSDNSGFDRFDRRMDTSARATERHSGRIRAALGGIARSASYVGTAGIGFLGVKTVNVASDIAESTTKIEQLFGRQANRIQRFSKNAADAIGLSRQAALAAAGDYGTLFETIGLGDKESRKLSLRLVTLAQDLASFNNANPQEVLEALKSGLIGEAEPMRRFGALLSETRVQQEGWRMGLAKTGEELTDQQKVQARYQLILKDTEAAHGDFKRTSEGLANQQRILSARFTNIGGRIGDWLLPKVLALTAGTGDLLTEMEKGEGSGGKLRKILEDIGDTAKAAWPPIREVGSAVIDFVSEHPEISKAAVALGATYLALRGIGRVSRATPLGRGISALTAAVAGAAVVHAAHAVASRGGILGKLASGFLAPGSTPARPLFVKEVAPRLPGGAPGTPGAPGVPGGPGTAGKVGRFAKFALRGLGVLGVALTLDQGARALFGEPDRDDPARHPGGRGAASERARQATLRRLNADDDPERVAPHASRAMVQSEQEARRLQRAMRDVTRSIWQMSNDSRASLKDLEEGSTRNFRRIREEMGLNTDAGRAAAAKNFRATARAIAQAMQDGRTDTKSGMEAIERLARRHSNGAKAGIATNMDAAANAIRRTMRRSGTITKDGMEAIKHLMVEELKLYGLSEKDALASANVRTGEVRGGRRRQDFAVGGIASPGGVVGRWGDRGRDAVHAVLGRGEAVLNFIQQRVVNTALAKMGFRGGLRDVFSMTRGSKHYMAGGGIVGIPWAPGEEINAGILPLVTDLHNRFKVGVSDAFDRDRSAGHKSPGHNVTGTAVDFTGSPDQLDALASWLGSHGYSYIWRAPDHYDHLHAEFGAGSGGAIARALKLIGAIDVKGPASPLKRVVEANLERVRDAANDRMQELAGASTTPDGAGPGALDRWLTAALQITGQYTKSNLNALRGRAMQESGGNPNAQNDWDSNAAAGDPSIGLLQTTGSTFAAYHLPGMGNIRNPVHNAVAAIRYMLARYGHIVGPGAGGYAGGKQAIIEPQPGSIDNLVGSEGFLTGKGGRYSARASAVIGRIQKAIAAAGQLYELKNRRFDLTEEELIDEGDEDTPPTFNDPAIQHRAGELYQLMNIRGGQAKDYGRMLRYMRRLQEIYATQRNRLSTMVENVQGRLGKLPEKGGSQEQRRARKTLLERLERYREALKTVSGRLGGVREGIREGDFERQSTLIDVAELRKEFTPLGRHVFGLPGGLELPEWSAPDEEPVDGGAGEAEGQATPEEIARQAAEQLRAFQAHRASLFGEFGANFAARGANPFAGEMGQAAGAKFFGAGTEALPGGVAGQAGGEPGGGTKIYLTQEFQEAPKDPLTWSQEAANKILAAID